MFLINKNNIKNYWNKGKYCKWLYIINCYKYFLIDRVCGNVLLRKEIEIFVWINKVIVY